MTVDSPKEREVRPEKVSLRDRIAQEISEADGHASSVEPCGDATYEQMADAALAVMEPEYEWLSAEVDRQHGLAGGWFQRSLENGRYAERLREQLAAAQDELVAQNRLYRKVGTERDEKQFEIERLQRWVDRFRERLATAVVLPPFENVVDAVRIAVGRKGDERDEEAVAAVLDFLKSWGVSSSEVEAPTLTNESSISQQDACSVCGSTEIQYQPFSGGKEYYCPSCEDVHPYDEGRAPRRAQMLQDGEFEALEQEMRDRLEGRPSGSERLAPRSDEDEAVGQINEVCVWLARKGYAVNKDRSLVQDVRDAIRKAEANLDTALSAAGRVPEVVTEFADDDEDAAQAARSEATPEVSSASTSPADCDSDTAPREKLCGATEGMTGIECDRHPGHQDWHSGRHEPRTDGTESVGYPVTIQWPRMDYDRCAPATNTFREGDREPDQHVRQVRGTHSKLVYTRRLEGFGGPWDYETGGVPAWTGWEALLRAEWAVEICTEQETKK